MKFINICLLSAASFSGTFVFGAPQIQQSIPVGQVPAGKVMVDQQALETLFFQLESLQQEVSELRGSLEEQQYLLSNMQKQSKERYENIDDRIRQLSLAPVTGTQDEQSATQVKEDHIEVYKGAMNLIKDKDYAQALSVLEGFINDYPTSSRIANAHYWAGEIYLTQANLIQSQTSFEVVVNAYPNHAKVPDSLYKIASIQQSKREFDVAKKMYQQIINDYPGTNVAKLSQTKLSKLQ